MEGSLPLRVEAATSGHDKPPQAHRHKYRHKYRHSCHSRHSRWLPATYARLAFVTRDSRALFQAYAQGFETIVQ
jgi:hypothetical protein